MNHPPHYAIALRGSSSTTSSSSVPGTLLLVNVAQLLPLALSICSHCLETKDRRQTKTERLPPFDVNNN